MGNEVILMNIFNLIFVIILVGFSALKKKYDGEYRRETNRSLEVDMDNQIRLKELQLQKDRLAFEKEKVKENRFNNILLNEREEKQNADNKKHSEFIRIMSQGYTVTSEVIDNIDAMIRLDVETKIKAKYYQGVSDAGRMNKINCPTLVEANNESSKWFILFYKGMSSELKTVALKYYTSDSLHVLLRNMYVSYYNNVIDSLRKAKFVSTQHDGAIAGDVKHIKFTNRGKLTKEALESFTDAQRNIIDSLNIKTLEDLRKSCEAAKELNIDKYKDLLNIELDKYR